MCFIHRTHYSARHLSGTFEKCWLPWSAKVGWRLKKVEGVSGRSSSKWGCRAFSLWAAPWPPIDPRLNLKCVWYLLRCGWIVDERRSSVSDASVEPFYFWTHSRNSVYYYYCQPFNSLMIAYWISVSLRCAVSGSQCDRSASIKQPVVSSHITISSLSLLYCTHHQSHKHQWNMTPAARHRAQFSAIGLCLPQAATWLQINIRTIIIDIPATPAANTLLQCQ